MRAAILLLGVSLWASACDDGGTEPRDAAPDAPPADAAAGADGGPDAAPPPADAAPEGDAAADAAPDAAPPPDAGITGPAPNFDGRVMGVVRAKLGEGPDDGVALPGVSVRLEAADTNARGVPVATGADGRYELPPHPLGRYRVCASLAGFAAACHPEVVEITADSAYAVRHLDLAPEGGVLAVSLRLADDSPCAWTSTAFGTRVFGRARLVPDGGGAPLAEAVAGDQGRAVLAGLPPSGTWRLEAECESLRIGTRWTPDAPPALAMRFDNQPPKVGALTLEDAEGRPIRAGQPGQTVRVVVRAEDDDPLTFRFVDGHGTPLPNEGPVATLTLPGVPSQVVVLAEVGDGRGGYGEARGVFRVGAPAARFLGHVRDPDGAPVPGARVTLGRASAETDRDGFFRLEAAAGEGPFGLRFEAEGYAPHVLSVDTASADLRVTLQPFTRHNILPADEHTLQDDRGFVEVHLPPRAFAAPDGLPVRGLRVDVTGYDPTRPTDFPGEPVAVTPAGDPVRVRLVAAASVEITTAAGDAVALSPRRPAEIVFPAPPGEGRPDTMLLMSLDARSGRWVVEGEAELEGDVYRARVTHFSAWSMGVEVGDDEACIRVDVAPEYLGQFVLRASVEIYDGAPKTRTREWVPTETVNVVRGLKPYSSVHLEVVSLTDPGQVLDSQWISSQNAAVGHIGYPYIQGNFGCNAWHTVRLLLPRKQWLDRIVNSSEDGWQYYQTIGYGPGLTLSAWKQQWGFTAQDEADAVAFYNPQEFGLGRRAVCHARGNTPADLEMACCVAKYGHVGGSKQEALEDTVLDQNVGDTVCMEYSRGPGPDRFAKFLAFTPEGQLSEKTYFDTSGAKMLPGVCGHCHGRTQDWRSHGGDMGGRFVFFDAPAYNYSNRQGWTKLAQEERLRRLNRLVKMTHGDEGPYADYIDSLYHQGVDTPGASSSEADPLPGWSQHPDTYDKVVRPNCRTCHIWQAPPYDFATADPATGALARVYLCEGMMPNAMQPMLNIWTRLDPFPGDALTAALGAEPCFSNDQPPTVQIQEPANGTQLPVGGFLSLRLRATASDPEDGADCCTLTWTSDRDGILGHGREVDTVLGTPGAHRITVTARDSRYRVASAAVNVTAVNLPPTPEIRFPEMNLDSLYRGVPYVLRGRSGDGNAVLDLPCDALRWTSSRAGDPFPADGCHPETTFETNGQRTLTLRATDPHGAAASVQRTINVPDPPLNSPPIVTILAPVEEAFHDGHERLLVRGSAVDPDARGDVQWRFRVWPAHRGEAGAVVIGAGVCAAGAQCRPQVDWNPLDDLFANCGGYAVVVELSATDDDGTNVARVTFYLGFPVC